MAKHKTNVGPDLTEEEELVIQKFIQGMTRLNAYRSVFNISLADKTIYNWFKLPKVQNYLKEYESSLADYNVVTDEVLIEIFTNRNNSNKDKIAAIKLWADIRNRIKNVVKIESEETINIGEINDKELEKIILQIQNGNNSSVEESIG